MRGFEKATRGSGFAEAEARQGEYDRRCDVAGRALRRLVRAPAPDLRAVGVKLRLIVEHELWSLSGGEGCLGAVRRDVERLSRGDSYS